MRLIRVIETSRYDTTRAKRNGSTPGMEMPVQMDPGIV